PARRTEALRDGERRRRSDAFPRNGGRRFRLGDAVDTETRRRTCRLLFERDGARRRGGQDQKQGDESERSGGHGKSRAWGTICFAIPGPLHSSFATAPPPFS